MTDIVEQAREWGTDARDQPPISLLHDLADEIERLREALEKIAAMPINWASLNPHDYARPLGRFQLIADAALQKDKP